MDTVYCFIAHGYNGSICYMVTWFAHEFNRYENHLANYTFAYEFTHTAIVSQNLGLRTCLPARQTWRK